MKAIEKSVLKAFKSVNPSEIITEDDGGSDWESFLEMRRHIFLDRLHLPTRMFNGARLLDMGCGTGKNTSAYASWGARVNGIDFNEVALAKLRANFEARGLTEQLEGVDCVAVSQWEPPTPSLFDIAVSDGVIHHLDDPREGYRKLCRAVKPGGFVAVSVHPDPGYEQREVIRRVLRTFADSLEEATELALVCFPEYLERATRIARRSVEQVVSDKFHVEQDVAVPVIDMLSWAHEEGLELYRTWPCLEPHFTDSASNAGVDWLAPGRREVLARQAEAWAYINKPDVERFDNPAHRDGEEDARRAVWLEEIATIYSMIDGGDKDGLMAYLAGCKVFGRGYMGAGEFWLVGVKKFGDMT